MNPDERSKPAWWPALLLGLAVFVVLQWAWDRARNSAIERALIHGATVGTAVASINLLTPEVRAQAVGSRIRAPGGGLNILNGCEGTEVWFLLIAALTAYRAGWRQRLVGLLVGTALVFVLNQGRVLMLFYAYRSDADLFSLLHGFVLPLLLVVATLCYFLAWARWADRADARPRAALDHAA